MKKILFTTILLFTVYSTFPDRYITRGPNPGEIYFLGPTVTGEGLYYSTDYGMTAICVDSTIYQALTITADKTPGVVYYATMSESLYISYDYGNQGSWQYANSGIYLSINSGVIEGNIYNAIVSHSENFGSYFIPHNYIGFFGSLKATEIDNLSNTGYAIVNNYGVNDSLYLLISFDNFENLEIKNTLPIWSTNVVKLSRGNDNGEIYLFNRNEYRIYYSNSYGTNWTIVNSFNSSFVFDDMVGGRNAGEVYILFRDINSLWGKANTYILFSNDYGITFNVFQPFKKGQEPLLSNFSAKIAGDDNFLITDYDSVYFVSGEVPLTVQFYNYSIGEITQYEWDFENDGVIDSYEEFPVHIYQDTGWYSVKLSVVGPDSTNSFIKENYIHIIDTTTDVRENESYLDKLEIFPNPFSSALTIRFNEIDKVNNQVKIYNYNGENINVLTSNTQSIIWNGYNRNGQKCNPGIYYIKANNSNSIHKIILTH